jgi:fructokinase
MTPRTNIVGMGELLWDLLPGGRQLGGAPANVAIHARQLGADSAVVSAVGDDPPGHELIGRLRDLGVATTAIAIHPTLPTGTVTVELAADGQPRFTIEEPVAWDEIEAGPAASAVVATADAVIFGSLAQRAATSRESLRRLLAAAPETALRVFDVNLRQHFHSPELIDHGLRLATVCKLNDAELARLGPLLGLRGDERAQLRQLTETYQLKLAALTRGSRGSLLCSAADFSEHPGLAATVVDTVGAGDSFTACLTLGLLHRWELDRINHCANELAAFVCAQPGATPPLPEPMRHWFRDHGADSEAS